MNNVINEMIAIMKSDNRTEIPFSLPDLINLEKVEKEFKTLGYEYLIDGLTITIKKMD